MLEAIRQRRSVREFKPDPVPREAIQEIIEAAFSAPTAQNRRPWHLIVITDPAKRQALAQFAPCAAVAPVVMIMCGNEREAPHFWIEDCSAATENAMIQAAALGLGTCWIGLRGSDEHGYEREQAVRELLGIPDCIRILCMFPVGYPATAGKNKGPGPMDHVHWERW